MHHTANYSVRLNVWISIEKVTGKIPDIAELLDFGFYDCYWYRKNAGLDKTLRGRCLSVSHRVGLLMLYCILTQRGTVISRNTVQRVTHLESQTLDNKEVFHFFDAAISGRFNEEIFETEGAKPNPQSWADIIGDDPDFAEEFQIIINDKDVPEADDNYDPDIYEDTYANLELAIDRGEDGPAFARVTKRLKGVEGRQIGVANDNKIPIHRCMRSSIPMVTI